MKETIQLIGAISQKPDGNIREFHKAALYYRSKGYNVIDPHDIETTLRFHNEVNGLPEPTEKEIMALCLQSLLTKATRAVILDDIDLSTGAPVEMFACKSYNVPVFEAYTERPIDLVVIMGVIPMKNKYKTTIAIDTSKLKQISHVN